MLILDPRCLPVTAHASSLVALDVSPDGRALLAVGQDSHAKQLIALWDISELKAGGQVSDSNQQCWTLALDAAAYGGH